jgi:hypothetical protein
MVERKQHVVRLLDEKGVIAPIRKMVKGCSDLRIAVAFWGEGAAKTLRLTGARRGRIICNLESGSCNPKEVRKLLTASRSAFWSSFVISAVSPFMASIS